MKEITADMLQRLTLSDWQPGRLSVGDRTLELQQCLRLLPGKRIAARARLNGDRVFAKVFFHPGHADAAEREKDNMERLAAAGVNVPAPLALIGDDKLSVLLVTWLEGGVALGAKLQEGGSTLDDFLRQVRLIYDAGYYQGDLHLDNFVLAGNRLWVVDSGDIRRLPVGGRAQRVIRRNLALLCAQANLDQAAFLQQAVTDFFRMSPSGARRLARLTRRLRNRRIAHANRKWLRACSAVEVRPGKGETRYLDRAVDGGVEALLSDPERCPLIKRGSRISVFGNEDWVIKHYRDDSLKARIKSRLGLQSARRSWVMGRTLHLLGVPTPCPVAWSRRDDGTSVVVFPRVGGRRFSELLQQQRDRAEDLAGGIWHWIGLIGMAGFWHGDMKAQNILVSEDGAWFVDLDAAGWSACRYKAMRRHRRDVRRFRKNWTQFRPWKPSAGTS